jgi:hypothetical protein
MNNKSKIKANKKAPEALPEGIETEALTSNDSRSQRRDPLELSEDTACQEASAGQNWNKLTSPEKWTYWRELPEVDRWYVWQRLPSSDQDFILLCLGREEVAAAEAFEQSDYSMVEIRRSIECFSEKIELASDRLTHYERRLSSLQGKIERLTELVSAPDPESLSETELQLQALESRIAQRAHVEELIETWSLAASLWQSHLNNLLAHENQIIIKESGIEQRRKKLLSEVAKGSVGQPGQGKSCPQAGSR